MAKQIITKLIDDLDGGAADETVKFALDGVQYEIDLSEKNAAKLRKALAAYVDAGTRASTLTPTRVGARAGQTGPQKAAVREQRAAIRAWAKKYEKAIGIKVGSNGRIPGKVVDAYHRHGGKAPAGYQLPESVQEISERAQTSMTAAFLDAAAETQSADPVPARPARRRAATAVKAAASKPDPTSTPVTRAPRRVTPKKTAERALAESAGLVPTKAK